MLVPQAKLALMVERNCLDGPGMMAGVGVGGEFVRRIRVVGKPQVRANGSGHVETDNPPIFDKTSKRFNLL
jgi:hypothetical protein